MKATTLLSIFLALNLLCQMYCQQCNTNDFIVSNGQEVLLKISSTSDVRACNVNICEQLTNGLQTLSLSTDQKQLTISNGNSVALPDDSPTNELQSLSISGGKISLSNGGGSVDLPASESQQLSLASDGTQLALSSGGGSAAVSRLACSSTSDTMCAMLSSLQSTIAQLSTKIDTLQNQIDSSQTQIDSLQYQIDLSQSKQELIGTITPHGSPNVPSGWLLCDGRAVSRTTYNQLFAVIAVTYGPGDSVTTFNLPDLRGRAVVGAGTGTGLTSRSVNAQFGAENVTLSVNHMPPHSHPGSSTATDGGHDHGNIMARNSVGLYPVYSSAGGTGSGYFNRPETEMPNAYSTGSNPWKMTSTAPHSHQVNVASQGSSAPVSILPPSVAINYVIKY